MKGNEIKELTRAEEQVMQILWDIGKGFVNEILEKVNDPKPAYNTVSTIVRILEKKGFVSHLTFGKAHLYYPLVTKREYTRSFLKRFVNNYFGSSYTEMVSFFTQDESLSLEEMEEIRQVMKENIRLKKKW